MPYTTEDGGRLNNFAKEPKMYTADTPSSTEKRNYFVLGALGLGLVLGVMAIAFVVS
ncbi:photosystem II assembly protein Psb34 [Limnothrix redekei]|uniref:Ssl1498 family light-harvesting-like protein n=1 Tax=Limnothrix redekei LRLZ20PSL1 TaxID=3112953 RepID=A0ABW7CEF4_9CYAN